MIASRISAAALVGLLVLAFGGAFATHTSGLMSLVPPDGTTPDAIGRELALYQSAYTAWVALILLMPAYIYVWAPDKRVWLAFWGTSYVAYLVHLAVSMFGFFGGDFGWMTSTSRVSAFWPGMAIAIWWPVDLALAQVERTWVRVQRVILHIVVFVLFFGGSAIKGEMAVIQFLGWGLLAVTLLALGRWINGRRYG